MSAPEQQDLGSGAGTSASNTGTSTSTSTTNTDTSTSAADETAAGTQAEQAPATEQASGTPGPLPGTAGSDFDVRAGVGPVPRADVVDANVDETLLTDEGKRQRRAAQANQG